MKPDIKTLVQKVLEKGYLMSLGVQDDAGVWVADVIYIFDEKLNIYWMSDPDTRHSKAIEKNPHVAGTITVCVQGEPNLGLQFEGNAVAIDGARYDLAKKHYAKRKKPEPKESDDVLEGDSWYMIKPQAIHLIDEEHFGFNRQSLALK